MGVDREWRGQREVLPLVLYAKGLSIRGLLKKILVQEVPPGDDPFDLTVLGDDG